MSSGFILNASIINMPYKKLKGIEIRGLIKSLLERMCGCRMIEVDYDEYKEHMKSQDIKRAVYVNSRKNPGKKYKVSIGFTNREGMLLADRRYGFYEIHFIDDATTAIVFGINRKLYEMYPDIYDLGKSMCLSLSHIIGTDGISLFSDSRSRRASLFSYIHNSRVNWSTSGKDSLTEVRDKYGMDVNNILEKIYENEDSLLSLSDLSVVEQYLKDYRRMANMLEHEGGVKFNTTPEEDADVILSKISEDDKLLFSKQAEEKHKIDVESLARMRTALLSAVKTENEQLADEIRNNISRIEKDCRSTSEERLKALIIHQVKMDRSEVLSEAGYVNSLLNERDRALTLVGIEPACTACYFKMDIPKKGSDRHVLGSLNINQ